MGGRGGVRSPCTITLDPPLQAQIKAAGDPNSVNVHVVKDSEGESRLLLLQGNCSILADFVEENTTGNADLALGARSAKGVEGKTNLHKTSN